MSVNGVSQRIQQFLYPDGQQPHTGTQSPFQRLALHMEDVLGDGGILKEVIHGGEGQSVPKDASVLARFSGFLEYSDRPFESNANYKFPQMMKLGKDTTLAGLEIGFLTMKKGEFSRFLFQPRYAFGNMGCPPLIPPAATVLYEVQLLDFLDCAEVDDFFALCPEEQNTIPLQTVFNVVNTERSFGNRCFKQSRYEDAKDRYKKALTLLNNRKAVNEEEGSSISVVRLPILLNLSLTMLRLERPHRALKYAQLALDIDPRNTKALFRCGKACMEMEDYEKAQDFLLQAQAKQPLNSDINSLLKKLALTCKDLVDKEREMCAKMFAGSSLKKASREMTKD